MDFYRYQGAEPTEDALLAGWYMKMQQRGDLELLFGTSNYPLSKLYALMAPPTELYYTHNGMELTSALWLQPFMAGPALSIWGPGHLPELIVMFRVLCRQVFEVAPVIMSVTCQENLVDLFARVGYILVGEAEELFYGKTAYICTLRKADFHRCNPEPVDGLESDQLILPRPPRREVA